MVGIFQKFPHLDGLHKLYGDMAGGGRSSVTGQSPINEKNPVALWAYRALIWLLDVGSNHGPTD